MTYSEAEVAAVGALMEKYRGGLDTEAGVALAVVGLSAERAHRETVVRDNMIRVAHRSGASIRQVAEASGLGHRTVIAIVDTEAQSLTKR